VYLGGTHDFQPSGFIRVDVTGLSDPHSLFLRNDMADGGSLQVTTTDAAPLYDYPHRNRGADPLFNPIMNLIRNPTNLFNGNANYLDNRTARFANTGVGAKWKPFDIGGTDQHRIVTFRDPVTGYGRIIIGDDQGMYTALDINGTLSTGVQQGENESGGG